jgi:putative peptidoglycan lipid II flippase
MRTKLKSYLVNGISKLRQPIFRNFLIVSSLVFLVKIISFYKETLVSSYFGLSEFLDTYYLAILIPSFAQNVFFGALKNLFIPNYLKEMKNENKLGSFQAFTIVLITGINIVLSVIIYFASDVFLEDLFPNHEESYYLMVRKQLLIVLPCLFFWGYSGILGGLLEIKSKFFIATLPLLITPITIITLVINFKDYFGDLVLVMGMLIGAVIGFLFLLIAAILNKVLKIDKISMNRNIQEMLREYPPKLTSGLLAGANPFVDQYFAAQLVVGSIASLNYGIKIPTFFLSILMIALGNVLLPHFSKKASENLTLAFTEVFKTLKLLFIIAMAITLPLIFFSEEIIRLLFEYGQFDSENTKVVFRIQQIALFYVPFYLCTLVCVKFLTVINKNKFMAWFSLWNLVVNLVLNIVLIKFFGVFGLVLSTSLVFIISSLMYVGFTYKFYQQHLALIKTEQ